MSKILHTDTLCNPIFFFAYCHDRRPGMVSIKATLPPFWLSCILESVLLQANLLAAVWLFVFGHMVFGARSFCAVVHSAMLGLDAWTFATKLVAVRYCIFHWNNSQQSAMVSTSPSSSSAMASKCRKCYHKGWPFLSSKMRAASQKPAWARSSAFPMLIVGLLPACFQTCGRWRQNTLRNCFRHADFTLSTETAISCKGNDSMSDQSPSMDIEIENLRAAGCAIFTEI